MNIPMELLIERIYSSDECRSYLISRYSYEYEVWNRFSLKNGIECSFARAALKTIFRKEYESRGQEFLSALGSKEWGSIAYQAGS